ncbi:MAG: hypothetical protein KF833_04560 [Verrucomicrobiae bacterium]|nr:hypothetical protein [Verrucomicrobiae bacterium]
MKRHCISTLLTLLVISGAATTSRVAKGEPPTLIVAPFTGDRVHIQYWQPALGSGLADMLVTEVGRIGKFTVLETIHLDVLKDEIREGQDGWIDAAEMVEKGGFAAADFMLTGKVTRFGAQESNTGVGGIARRVGLGNVGIRQSSVDVRIDWRLVDASHRRVIKTGSATAEKRGTSFNVSGFGRGSGGGISHDNREFMDSALVKATVDALGMIVEELRPVTLPESGRVKRIAARDQAAGAAASAEFQARRATAGKVLAAPSRQAIIVSLGKAQGFRDGEKLNLYEAIEIRDEHDVVVFTEEKLVGELTIQSAQEERSRAVYEGDLEVKAGWVVKAK